VAANALRQTTTLHESIMQGVPRWATSQLVTRSSRHMVMSSLGQLVTGAIFQRVISSQGQVVT